MAQQIIGLGTAANDGTGDSARTAGGKLNAMLTELYGFATPALTSPAQGSILYHNGSAWVKLPPGSNGQVLQTAGASANPGWVTPAGGLSAITNNKLLANTSGSSAAPVETTPTALLDAAIGSTQGSVLYRSGTAWTPLAPGTSGQVLQTNGASANPSWTTLATGGLSAIANNKLLANTSGSSAVPVETALTALLDAAIGSVRGNILFRGAANWSVLAPGTSGQVLQTGGAGADPSWTAATGTGNATWAAPVSVTTSTTTQTLAFPSTPGRNTHIVTLGSNAAISFTGMTAGVAQEIHLVVKGGSGGFSGASLPASSGTMVWPDGITPTLNTTAGAFNEFIFRCVDGTTVSGSY